MKSHLKKLLSVIICLFMLAGLFPAGAAENTVGIKRYGLNTYLSPVGAFPTGAVIAGDVNGDGETDNKDLTRLFQQLSGWDVTVNEGALDVNGDLSVDNKDLTRLFQYLSGWDVKIFPEPIACEHGGDTEIRDAKEPTCAEEGYTGDTYCLLCGSLIATGEPITTLPHTGGTATCHTKAVCDVCGTEYGEFDADNHSGGTEIRNGYPASCVRGGYTGDTYCLGCGEKLGEGEYSEPSGIHINTEVVGRIEPTCVSSGYSGDTVCSDCGVTVQQGTYLNIVNEHVHTEIQGDRKPTCTETGYSGDLVCTDCGALITAGSFIAPTGHLNTEIRDEMPATCSMGGYTGNTYCLDCGMLIDQGTYTEPT